LSERLKRIGEGVAGGLISGSVLLTVYLLATANMNGADGGDWLAFAGVVVGVGATIMGTLAIEQLKQRSAHKAAKASLLLALDIWDRTVADTPANLNPANFADLRQQHAYISLIAGDLNRDANAAKMGAHYFSFHIPAMINALVKVLADMEGAGQMVVVNHVVSEMRSYGTTARNAIAES
jgi:hypothetical protein